jgi:hypothetical protein
MASGVAHALMTSIATALGEGPLAAGGEVHEWGPWITDWPT